MYVILKKIIDAIKVRALKRFDYIVLFSSGVDKEKKAEIIKRAKFFLGTKKRIIITNPKLLPKEIPIPIGYAGTSPIIESLTVTAPPGVVEIDHDQNPFANWHWHILASALAESTIPSLKHNKSKYNLLIKNLKRKGLTKTYLFGTGPTLANYNDYNFSDGYKIACNTVVKDQEFFAIVKPDVIVAADGIFHFGYNSYAEAFRRDLRKRLQENPQLVFIYPHHFSAFVNQEFTQYADQLISIPVGEERDIETQLNRNYRLPLLGNILTIMLLPIACNLTKQIFLFGFDGKKPTDKLFWSHSQRHNYSEKIPEIIEMQPAFFRFHFPKGDKNRYIKENLAEDFEKMLTRLEKKGYAIHSMHPSYTTALNKRRMRSFKNQ